jgi:hypothetical protein
MSNTPGPLADGLPISPSAVPPNDPATPSVPPDDSPTETRILDIVAEWYERRSSRDTPVRDRIVMEWNRLAHWLNCRPPRIDDLMRAVHVQDSLNSLAELLVEACLSQRIANLDNPDIGDRGPVIRLLQRAVRIAEFHPSELPHDTELRQLLEAVITRSPTTDLNRPKWWNLIHEIRDEALEETTGPPLANGIERGEGGTPQAETKPAGGDRPETPFAATAAGRREGETLSTNSPKLPIPDWIKTHFSQKQYKLLCKLWGAIEVAADDLVKHLGYTNQTTALGNLCRRITETNRGLLEKALKIGKSWEIGQRQRDGVLFYFLRCDSDRQK